MDQGFSEQEAIKLVLQQFGDAAKLREEVKRSYPAPRSMMWLKELLIWALCLTAASVGPWLFIDARYSVFFVIFPMLVLLVCAFVFHVLLSRIACPPLWMIPGTLLLYAAFLFFVVRLTSLELVWTQFTTLSWSGDGLFTMSIIHLMWAAVVAYRLISSSSSSARMSAAVRSSFEFWMMNLVSLLIVSSGLLSDSGEGNVFILNLFLLYGTLHQVVNPRFMVITKNKLQYWIRRSLP